MPFFRKAPAFTGAFVLDAMLLNTSKNHNIYYPLCV